jgi:hypothetical protein
MRNKVLVTPATLESDDAFGQFFAMAAALNGIAVPAEGIEATITARMGGQNVDVLEVLSAMVLQQATPATTTPDNSVPAFEHTPRLDGEGIVPPPAIEVPQRTDLPVLIDPDGQLNGPLLMLTANQYHRLHERMRNLSPIVPGVEELRASVVRLVEDLTTKALHAKLANLRDPLLAMLQQLDTGVRMTAGESVQGLTRGQTRTHLEETLPGLREQMEEQRASYMEVHRMFSDGFVNARVDEMFEVRTETEEVVDPDSGDTVTNVLRTLLALGGARGESHHAAE